MILPTLTPLPTPTWEPTVDLSAQAEIIPIYTDEFQAGWTLYSPGGSIQADARSRGAQHSGSYSIAVIPQVGKGKLYIANRAQQGQVYPRSQVLGVRLWLYTGDRPLAPTDLALTAIGSNTLTYFSPEDHSVDSKTPYEETYLSYLGFNDTIPSHKWVEITIWLDQMLYDPDYQYFTGLYLTNRLGLTRTLYIDDVSLMLQKDAPTAAAPQAITTPTPQEDLPIPRYR